MNPVWTIALIKSAAGAFLCLMLGACGTLNVTMEVLDPQVVQDAANQTLVDSGLSVVLATTPETIAGIVNRAKGEHYQVYEKLASRYAAEAEHLPAREAERRKALAGQVVGLFSNIGPSYDSVNRDLVRYAADLKKLVGGKYTISPRDPEYTPAVAILRVWRERVTQLQNLIRNDKYLNAEISKLPLTDPDRAGLVKQVADAGAATAEATLAQISIQDSPFAYAVAQASDERWAQKYNKVFSRGDLGAFDVAIKLDPNTGNYLLKGLAFDPTDVARVASKVTTQALLIAAQVAGVPVKLASAPSADTAGAALSTSSGALADAQASLETRRAQDEARKSALLALANIIVNEQTNLQSDDGNLRKDAMAAIRNAFDKRQAILKAASSASP